MNTILYHINKFKFLDVKINGDTLEFSASGVGASGERRNYEFELDFFDHVDRGFLPRPGQGGIQLIIKKDRESCYMWKQLVRGQKPKFLKSKFCIYFSLLFQIS